MDEDTSQAAWAEQDLQLRHWVACHPHIHYMMTRAEPMAIHKGEGGSFTRENPEPGAHGGVLARVVEMGSQASTFNGETKYKPCLLFTFELDSQRESDGLPHVVSRRFNRSTHEKGNLRQFMESWRGKPFKSEEEMVEALTPYSRLVGQPAMLNVVESESGYANIAGVSKLPKGMPAIEPTVVPSGAFDLEDPDWQFFDQLSDGLRDKILNTDEGKAARAKRHSGPSQTPRPGPATEGDPDDEIPF
jgi:hypothetical protein